MSERLLIAGGCSYTDKNFKTNAPDFQMPEKTWPMWPEYLAKNLGLKDLNVARCGNDNFTIYESVLKAITLNEGKVEAVVVLWSGWDRSLLFNMFRMVTLNTFKNVTTGGEKWSLPEFISKTGLDDFINSYLNSEWWDPPSFVRDCVNSTLTLMYSLATICESKGIKYLFYQGVTPIDYSIINDIENLVNKKRNIWEKEIFSEIKRCPYSGKIEKIKNKVIGWPFLLSLGGDFLDDLRFNRKRGFKDLMKVSELDFHPNADAQPIIANIFYERWREIYG